MSSQHAVRIVRLMHKALTTWGNRIREARKALGLSQATLAEKLGVSQPTINRWELGRVEPKTLHRVALARFFDITVDDLFPMDEVA